MTYAQIKGGNKLHLVCQPGEMYWGEIIRAGHISAPLCRSTFFKGNYRMIINLPLANSCKNCQRVYQNHRFCNEEN